MWSVMGVGMVMRSWVHGHSLVIMFIGLYICGIMRLWGHSSGHGVMVMVMGE